MSDTWKSPGAILGIIAALVSIVSLYFSYVHASTEIQKVQIEVDKLNNYKNEQERKDNDKKQKLEELTSNIKKQIGEADVEIENCKHKLGEANWQLSKGNDVSYYTQMYTSYTQSWKEFQRKKDSLTGILNNYLFLATQ